MSARAALAAKEKRPVAAALLMLAAVTCFACMSALVRHISESLPPLEIAFFRNFLGLLILLPWLWRAGALGVLRTKRFGQYMLRAAVNVVSMLAWFTAVPLLPLADLTALGFTGPLWATLLAALMLGETVRARRWTATLVGFLGALIILQPGFREFNVGAVLVLFSAASWALVTILIRTLTATEDARAIVTYQVLLMAPLSLMPALFVWEWPGPETFLWLCLLAAVATVGHLCHVRACALQEVAALQPLDFAKLPVIAILAFIFFDELPTVWVWAGAAVIFASGSYISWREARLKAAASAPAPLRSAA